MDHNSLVKADTIEIDDDDKAEYERDVATLFTRDGGRYHYNGAPDVTAFTDHGEAISSKYDNDDIASAMTLLAVSKGWGLYETRGSDKFYTSVERHTEQLKTERETNTIEANKPEEFEELPVKRFANAQDIQAIHDQYRVSGKRFYFKDQIGRSNTLAFKDKGNAITTGINAERVTRSVVQMAVAKGWQTIKVSGHEEFRRQAWREAQSHGLNVQGYTPTAEESQTVINARTLKAVGQAVADDRIADDASREKVVSAINQRVDELQHNLPDVPVYDNNAPMPQKTTPTRTQKPQELTR